MLVFILYFIILRVEISFKLSLNILLFRLIYLMYVSNFFIFFFLYEIVFVLIMFVIILLGYRFERLIAAYLIIFYSFVFSRPIIILFLVFDYVFLMKSWLFYSFFVRYFLVGSFIVKFPIFGFHYWLPVAHVEASTIGSILLAGVLLKLGSVGLFYVVVYIQFIVKLHWLRIRVLIVILLILCLRDLKIIIAYSSIAHMSIVFYVIILGSFVAKKRGFINNVLSWVSFSFNILISWVISVMKNSFIICCKIYIYFFFIFFFNFYFKNYKYEISAFYRFFKRDSNIEIISNN